MKKFYKFFIKGVVQGVGFRPYIYNACVKQGLKGYVQNIGEGVIIVSDQKSTVEDVLKKIPPLARIDSIEIETVDAEYDDFSIKKSSGQGFAEVPPDLFLCPDCLKELRDENDPRFQYFFITCTNCGPRFSMTIKNPYDRDTTTMQDFPMCDFCQEQYTDPANRRYHAQTTACPECGPKLSLIVNGQQVEAKQEIDLIKQTADLLKQGQLVAIKGIGGFHIAGIINHRSIKKLRQITNRDQKPYALMCGDIEMAQKIVRISSEEEKVLNSIVRPIVVLQKNQKILQSEVYQEVSELDSLGVMLPYTGLHYLLFDYLDQPLIMTSSNISGSPITSRADEQIVNNILSHDRKIENKVDDSLVKVINDQSVIIRRSRGYVPKSIAIGDNFLGQDISKKRSQKEILAVGGQENNTIAVYKKGRITQSAYLGNTDNYQTYEYFKTMVDRFLKFTQVNPDVIVSDLNDGYNVSKYALFLAQDKGLPLFKIQHHIAHASSVACENNLNEFYAIICDGSGLGSDDSVWGGEIFYKNKRIGHLQQQMMLGGNLAAKEPWRMLFAILLKKYSITKVRRLMTQKLGLKFDFDLLLKQYQEKINTISTSSCGRILDAASSLLVLAQKRIYQGRPAMLLESALENSSLDSDLMKNIQPVVKDNIVITDTLFSWLHQNLDQKSRHELAYFTHIYLAKGLLQLTQDLMEKDSNQDKAIFFSGGVANNRLITKYMLSQGVLINQKCPVGDGGLSMGQIAAFLLGFEE